MYKGEEKVKKVLLMLLLICVIPIGYNVVYALKQPVTNEKHSSEIFAMDTIMTLTAYGNRADRAIELAKEEVKRLDKLLSSEGESSLIALINSNNNPNMSAELNRDAAVIIKKALSVYDETRGAFDITVYPLMLEWGFISREYKVPSKDRIDELLKIIGSDKIIFDNEKKTVAFKEEGMAIDLGGIAKGYTSNSVIEIFKKAGVTSGIISLGGNVQTLGTRPDGSLWRVGIQNPLDLYGNLGVVTTSDKALITSGGYQRYFEKDGVVYHHILNPKTGMPANEGLISVTIVADDGMLADALSTSLFVMGEEAALDYWKNHNDEFDAVLVRDDGSIIVTAGLKDNFESEHDFEVVYHDKDN